MPQCAQRIFELLGRERSGGIFEKTFRPRIRYLFLLRSCLQFLEFRGDRLPKLIDESQFLAYGKRLNLWQFGETHTEVDTIRKQVAKVIFESRRGAFEGCGLRCPRGSFLQFHL